MRLLGRPIVSCLRDITSTSQPWGSVLFRDAGLQVSHTQSPKLKPTLKPCFVHSPFRSFHLRNGANGNGAATQTMYKILYGCRHAHYTRLHHVFHVGLSHGVTTLRQSGVYLALHESGSGVLFAPPCVWPGTHALPLAHSPQCHI